MHTQQSSTTTIFGSTNWVHFKDGIIDLLAGTAGILLLKNYNIFKN